MGAELRAALPLGRSTATTKQEAESQESQLSVTLSPNRVTEIYLRSLKGSHIGSSMECFLEEEEEELQPEKEFTSKNTRVLHFLRGSDLIQIQISFTSCRKTSAQLGFRPRSRFSSDTTGYHCHGKTNNRK